MCRAKHPLAILLTLLLLVGSMALAKDPKAPVPGGITVGEFALKVVRLAEDDPTVRASITTDEAVARLNRAGVRFRGAPGDPLTAGERSSFFLAVANGLMDRIAPPPSGFDTCVDRATVPECQACCLGLAGGSEALCGRACGLAHADQQKASPSEPGG